EWQWTIEDIGERLKRGGGCVHVQEKKCCNRLCWGSQYGKLHGHLHGTAGDKGTLTFVPCTYPTSLLYMAYAFNTSFRGSWRGPSGWNIRSSGNVFLTSNSIRSSQPFFLSSSAVNWDPPFTVVSSAWALRRAAMYEASVKPS